MAQAAKKLGRPKTGTTGSKITVYLPPRAKAIVEALSTIEQRAAGKIMDAALDLYLQQVKPDDRKLVEMIVRRTLGGGQ